MKNRSNRICVILMSGIIIFLATGCKKADTARAGVTPVSTTPGPLGDLHAPDGFNYATDGPVQLNITILAPDNTAIANIPVYILDKPLADSGKILYTGLTDAAGNLTETISLPAYLTQVVVDPSYVGIIRNANVSLVGNAISCTLGGSVGYSGNVIPSVPAPGAHPSRTVPTSINPVFSYIGTFDSHGKPNYLQAQGDLISKQLLSFANASLPNGRPVPTYHPEFLASTAETNIHVIRNSDVFLTFMGQGAASHDAIAYFTYPTSAPPQNVSAIDTMHIVLPNASMNGGGGELKSGDKIKLGTFKAGTSIGFAVIANGWNGSGVGTGDNIFYSLDNLNPESDPALKRHSVLLNDNGDGLFLIGFEDLRRDQGSREDFNEETFYVTTAANAAVATTNISPIDLPKDSDGDGVDDVFDQFSIDPARAYINEYPAPGTYGTIAFEDSWPYIGDYDMNDLVIGYHYQLINDALNRTVQINATYVLLAGGSTFHNGFGVEFPFAASLVKSATGTKVVNSSIVTLASNGCEARQNKAVVVAFDDAFAVMNTPGDFNTFLGVPKITPDTIRMTIKLNSPVTAAAMGSAPYNPFIIIDGTRGREEHLPGHTPTQLMDTRLFKTGQDNTNPGANKYYKTASNLPWSLAFTGKFAYPKEGAPINLAYSDFIPWAQSGGAVFPNWFGDANNMVPAKIYH